MFCSVLTVGTQAHADDDDDLEEARKLYELGNAHYAAGRYEEAAAAFQKGYDLSELPGFLYNLANAFERMGKYEEAADRLERYLKSPKAKDVVSARERVRRLKAAAEERRREIRKQKAREEEARKLALRRGEKPPEREARYETLPRAPTYLYFLGGGGAALASGVVLGLVSQSAGTSAAGGCSGAICTREAQADLDREKTFAAFADVSFGVGAVLVGVGAYLYLSGPPKRRIPDSELDDSDSDGDSDSDDDDDDDDTEIGFAPMLGPDTIGVVAGIRF